MNVLPLSQLNPQNRTIAPVRIAFRHANGVGTLSSLSLSWHNGRLQAPLSTLCRAPRDALRMTRRQFGLLFFSC